MSDQCYTSGNMRTDARLLVTMEKKKTLARFQHVAKTEMYRMPVHVVH